MSRRSLSFSGWRGISLIAITYVYFLIFAQFGFLKHMAELNLGDAPLKIIMTAMAVGGIVMSLLAPRLRPLSNPKLRMEISLVVCGCGSLASIRASDLFANAGVALLIGLGLGLLTVTMVTHLGSWLGATNQLLKVGVGTGIGYFVCNFPPLFTATPRIQAVTSAGLCLAGILMVFGVEPEEMQGSEASGGTTPSFLRILVCFTALIWLDSAAFYIIQKTPLLKARTWEGSVHLWANGALHLLAAVATAWLLRRRGLPFVLSFAILALSCACLLLLAPDRVALASLFYPVGVSLYSVALVAYPSLLAPASSVEERGRRVGWIYAIAGWVGSGLGIGMGQHLGHVPPAFVALACVVVLAPLFVEVLRRRGREVAATAAVLLLGLSMDRALLLFHSPHSSLSSAERGRRVYIAEGCIHCHSQYVRPGTSDVVMWGPTETVDELREQRPPLIGNRRQGPDLSEVGLRRSKLWMKIHFYEPAELNHASFMPSYRDLFAQGSRGEDLIAYLRSLKAHDADQHLRLEDAWAPSPQSIEGAQANEGPRLFAAYCSTCHTDGGLTRAAWGEDFRRLPPDLAQGPWLHLPPHETSKLRQIRLARIVKFGISGTDMPGHEYLSDEEIASLSLWLQQRISNSTSISSHQHFLGGNS